MSASGERWEGARGRGTRTTRRGAIARATLGAAAIALEALAGPGVASAQRVAGGPRPAQVQAARALLAAERATLDLYERAPRHAPFDARRMAAVEAAHVRRVERVLERLGGTAEPERRAASLSRRAAGTAEAWLGELARAERRALQRYAELLVLLDDDVLLVPVASAACADAQQLALIERARGIELPDVPLSER